MIISKYIIKKLISSFFISIFIVLSVLFIFSLIGNFGSNYDFSYMLFLSLISSFQILFYIPLIFLLILIMVFVAKISSYNEIGVILHYHPIKRIFFIFLTLIIFFSILEGKKAIISEKFENIKMYYTDNQNFEFKVLINDSSTKKEYMIIKKSNISKNLESINIYQISNEKDVEAIFSNDINHYNNNIMLNTYYKLFRDKIEVLNNNLLTNNEFDKIFKSNKKINYLSKDKKFFLNINEIKIILIILLSEILIFIQIFDKDFLSKRSNKIKIYTLTLLIIFYTYLIINLELESYNIFFQTLSFVVLLSLITKKFIRL